MRATNRVSVSSTSLLLALLIAVLPARGLGTGYQRPMENRRRRDERLSLEWFRNRIDAKVVSDSWRRHYNVVRPHSSLGNRTRYEFKSSISSTPADAIFQVGSGPKKCGRSIENYRAASINRFRPSI